MGLALAYPGNPYEWWLRQVVEDEQLVATAIEILEERD